MVIIILKKKNLNDKNPVSLEMEDGGASILIDTSKFIINFEDLKTEKRLAKGLIINFLKFKLTINHY